MKPRYAKWKMRNELARNEVNVAVEEAFELIFFPDIERPLYFYNPRKPMINFFRPCHSRMLLKYCQIKKDNCPATRDVKLLIN